MARTYADTFLGHIRAWSPEVAYRAGGLVRHKGMIWTARAHSRGMEPGMGEEWGATTLGEIEAALAPVGTDKATMAEAIDSRIGRGL